MVKRSPSMSASSSSDTDSSICSSSPKKYNRLTRATTHKKYNRRPSGSSPRASKSVHVAAGAVRRSPKKKTLWMRWLWAYHCRNQKRTRGVSYKESMQEAGQIYKKNPDFLRLKNKNPTDHQLAAFARKILG